MISNKPLPTHIGGGSKQPMETKKEAHRMVWGKCIELLNCRGGHALGGLSAALFRSPPPPRCILPRRRSVPVQVNRRRTHLLRKSNRLHACCEFACGKFQTGCLPHIAAYTPLPKHVGGGSKQHGKTKNKDHTGWCGLYFWLPLLGSNQRQRG